MQDLFPNQLSYNRFIEQESRVAVEMMLFIQLFCFGRCTGISFIDSTCVPVCHNKRIKRNKVFKGCAEKCNMKNKLMPLYDKILLRKRSVIETINDELKNVAQLVHSRHRSVFNFAMNVLSVLAAYSFYEKKPSINIDYCIEHVDGQLTVIQ